MKRLLIVRHCQAEGQEPEAKLTEIGRNQALALAEFIGSFKLTCIVSSPYRRAVQSIEPLAQRLQLAIETDPKLIEAGLGSAILPNWLDHLRDTFSDHDLCLEGGESSRQATQRVVAAVEEILNRLAEDNSALIVSHGRLITLLLRHFDETIGYAEWSKLTNPDVFEVTLYGNTKPTVRRIWQQNPGDFE